MKIGISGHQNLKNSDWAWTRIALAETIESFDDKIIGYSSLAIGADQLFAELLIEKKHSFIAVLPFKDIQHTFETETDKEKFYKLLYLAKSIITLETNPNENVSFFNAGKMVCDLADFLIAIWDEKPAKGLGGTGDIVKYAQQQGKNVILINPYKETISNF